MYFYDKNRLTDSTTPTEREVCLCNGKQGQGPSWFGWIEVVEEVDQCLCQNDDLHTYKTE